ncbi:MmcQ/YjbR family DNA-binding protein [Hyunsoonleella flava]|uniref:MmcQ/YjbR family DNA-binding protein n=1 Tax=Hyunsoonleella flava TaxID=2527939 RepID=A0A4Q9FIJ4_9FLAO|nr:MmcQ/YjbR family DNA-binding protein [Hyunsoonleella flava]TBN05312.1 MmcQ/YjbR family DNA-binding protein [Hyunsoonleella flava]
MNIEQIRAYCLAKKASTEEFPFDEHTLVFKVLGKMFLMAPLRKWEAGEATITLKCDPNRTMELRDRYPSIYAGPYVSNKHWNTVDLFKGEISAEFTKELIDHSYDMVVKGMTKKMRDSLL